MAVEVGGAAATAARALTKASGNVRFRFLARRRIPRAACGESEYFDGTAPVSKMSDNKHPSAALRDSKMLRVQYAPRHTVPEVIQRVEQSGKIASASSGEKPWNLLDDHPGGSAFPKEPGKLPPQAAAVTPKTLPRSGHG